MHHTHARAHDMCMASVHKLFFARPPASSGMTPSPCTHGVCMTDLQASTVCLRYRCCHSVSWVPASAIGSTCAYVSKHAYVLVHDIDHVIERNKVYGTA